jgi:hypothetical protein
MVVVVAAVGQAQHVHAGAAGPARIQWAVASAARAVRGEGRGWAGDRWKDEVLCTSKPPMPCGAAQGPQGRRLITPSRCCPCRKWRREPACSRSGVRAAVAAGGARAA